MTDTTFYRWKRQFAWRGVSDWRELRRLRNEIHKRKQLVAALTSDKTIPRESLRQRNW